jgi:two-component system NtrC family sensor kinase
MARQQAAARAPVRLEPLITGSLDLLGYGLKSAGIEVVTQIAPDLPPTLADPDQLAQVFNYLIVNAQQALMDWRGPRRIRIEARLDPAGPHLEVRVADTGPGIPADARPRVFDPFFTTKPAGIGTGIGLAVCRGIVEAHGGSIRLEDPEKGGAAFVVTLPIGPQEGATAAGAPAGPAPKPGKRILIAEDEPDIGQMLEDILKADGHTVTSAANGKQALACLSAQAFDLVISDLIMPELDGPGLYRALAKRDRTLAERVLFITGDTLSPTAKRFLSRVKRPVIEKPFLPEDIRRAVDAITG